MDGLSAVASEGECLPLLEAGRIDHEGQYKSQLMSTFRELLSDPSYEYVDVDGLLKASSQYNGPPVGIEMFLNQDVVEFTTEDVRKCATRALSSALNRFGEDQDLEWKAVFRQLIRLGADVHDSEDDTLVPFSLIHELQGSCRSATQLNWAISEWMEVLAVEQVNILNYISTESLIHEGHSDYTYNSWSRPLIVGRFVFSIADPPSIWFEQWKDPASEVTQLLEEFACIGLYKHNCLEGASEDYWPCGDYWWRCCDRSGLHPEYEGAFPPEHLEKLDLASKRFQRRERKKMRQRDKSQGFKDVKSEPGARIG